MLKLNCLIIIIFLSINNLNAQEKRPLFQIMTSNGYMESELGMDGSGHIITFLYSPKKLWGYGFDATYLQGKNRGLERKYTNISLSPSIYLFPLNNNRHQIYLGAGIGYGYTDIDRIKTYAIHPSFLIVKNSFVIYGANTGYNYKFKKNWLIGARVYYEYNYFSSIMSLINIGYRF